MNVTIIITVLVLLAGCHWIKNDEMLWRKHAVVLTPGIGEMIDGKLAHGSIVKLDDGTERHGSGDFGVCLPGENAMVDVGIFKRSHKIGKVYVVMCKPYIDANGNRKDATENDIREAEESARKFYSQHQ